MRALSLDTNAYTALGTGNKQIVSLLKNADSVGLPIIVLGEIHFGIYNGSNQAKGEEALRTFFTSYRLEVLNVNEQTARFFGEISTELRKAGKPMQQNDVWIAALCKHYGYPLVTADKGFCEVTGLEVLTF